MRLLVYLQCLQHHLSICNSIVGSSATCSGVPVLRMTDFRQLLGSLQTLATIVCGELLDSPQHSVVNSE